MITKINTKIMSWPNKANIWKIYVHRRSTGKTQRQPKKVLKRTKGKREAVIMEMIDVNSWN